MARGDFFSQSLARMKVLVGDKRKRTVALVALFFVFCVSGFSGGERAGLRASVLHGVAQEQVHEVLKAGIFTDVSASHQYAYAIAYLKQAGLVDGYEDGTFRPDVTMSRAEMVAFVTESLRIAPYRVRYGHCFADVTNEWFAPFICFAAQQGWVKGEEVLVAEGPAAALAENVAEVDATGEAVSAETVSVEAVDGDVKGEGGELAVEAAAPRTELKFFPADLASGADAVETALRAYGLESSVRGNPGHSVGALTGSQKVTRGQMAQLLYELQLAERPM